MNHIENLPNYIVDRQQVNQIVQEFMNNIIVKYDIILKSNTTVCTVYFKNKETGQKFFICTGSSNSYFEQVFDVSLGEKYSYEEAIKNCRTKLYELVYFYYFVQQGAPTCFSSLKSILPKLEQHRQVTSK